MSPAHTDATKVFVLDTSVILYDSNAVNSFQEHDVAVPLVVLEELDTFKKGNSVMNLQAREFIRSLDRLSEDHDLRSWVPINGAGRGRFRVIAERAETSPAVEAFGSRKNDHRILDTAFALQRDTPERRVILVSKDTNLRIKARSLGLTAEDYETVRIKDVTRLYSGRREVNVERDDIIDRLHQDGQAPLAELGIIEPPLANHYFIVRGPTRSGLAFYRPDGDVLERIAAAPAYGIQPRNAGQTFALHAIANPDLPLVSISGAAGTGKTLLAMAGALEQRRRYHKVLVARPMIPLGNRDIGYLPGDVDSKVGPYMEPLWDNLGVIKGHLADRPKDGQKLDELIERAKLQVLPLAYIRGRSLSKVFVIVDEAQNLTPHEVKTIITRAGEGTKVVFTGDIFQIDTPYLDANSNGLSYLIDRLKGTPLYAHVNLDRGERSELANLASRLL